MVIENWIGNQRNIRGNYNLEDRLDNKQLTLTFQPNTDDTYAVANVIYGAAKELGSKNFFGRIVNWLFGKSDGIYKTENNDRIYSIAGKKAYPGLLSGIFYPSEGVTYEIKYDKTNNTVTATLNAKNRY
ncbi:MAG: hypothetical protein ACP5KK_03000, partial [Candidatus Nanoarchaeia archaeon]